MMSRDEKNDMTKGHNYDKECEKLKKEWKKLEEEFLNDYEKSIQYNKSFSELISDVLDGETYMSFAETTKLSPNMLYRLKKQVDEKNPPQRNTIISVAVGYKLDLMMTQALLYSLGLGFNRFSKRDYAYTFLLTRCKGKTIDECNDVLERLGIEQKYWLGLYARKSVK